MSAPDTRTQTTQATQAQSTSAPVPVPLQVPSLVPLDEPPHEPASEPPRYMAWTDRWDPGKWEMPENPTPLQRVLAGVALVIVVVMTVWVPLRLLKIL